MKTWTESSRDRLESYLRNRVLREKLDPEEAAEIVEDWRLHVYEEVERQPESVVNLEMLELVLVRLGEDEGEANEGAESSQPVPRIGEPPTIAKRSARFWLWFFGVVLPFGVILFEAAAGFCESVFFDPMPTWIHFFVIAAVPAGNAWLLRRLDSGKAHKLMAPLCGYLAVVTGFYALLFLPLVPASLLALIVFGLGLLSLMPICAWVWSLALSRKVRRMFGADLKWKSGWRWGAVFGLLTLVALEAGPLVTRMGLAKAMSEDSDRARAGLAQLRNFHVRSTLLRACYEGNRGTTLATDISGWMMRGWQVPIAMFRGQLGVRHDSDEARDLFYRVTGKPFNSLRPPTWVTGNQWISRGSAWDSVEFDDHLGGDEVAVRLSGLSMSQSRIDAHLDRASSLGYVEWTSEFTNRSGEAREARFQVLLPEDGVISRVTLWVNGEPREAAFASKARVKAAYQEVAVRQRRDPILVTACGPGRAMVQCFPIPALGGKMMIRLGMTAPLKEGRLAMPVILERNFSMEHGLDHSVWVQSEDEFTFGGKNVASLPDGAGQSLQVSLEAEELGEDRWYARLDDDTPVDRVWCEDQFAKPGERRLARTWKSVERVGLKRCVVVLDGSVGLHRHRGSLARALESLSAKGNVRILLATDDWEEIEARDIRELRFSGGRDNIPALAEALQRARGEGESAVVWIHAPQPMRGPSSERLCQLLERSAQEVTLYSVPLDPGGNRILEDLFKFRAVRMGPRHASESGRLEEWMDQLLTGDPQRQAVWSRLAEVSDELQGRKVWDQLARWWAAEQVRRMRRVQVSDPEKIALAAKYQLVTAYSGAVVLETDDQYRRLGLKPVDADAVPDVPAVPEPSVVILLMPAAMLALSRRRRRKD